MKKQNSSPLELDVSPTEIGEEESVIKKMTESHELNPNAVELIDCKAFVAAVRSEDPGEVARKIMHQIKHLSSCVQNLWQKYLWLIGRSQRRLYQVLYAEYVREQNEGYSHFFIKRQLPHPQASEIYTWWIQNLVKVHMESAESHRANIVSQQSLNQLPLNVTVI